MNDYSIIRVQCIYSYLEIVLVVESGCIGSVHWMVLNSLPETEYIGRLVILG